MRWFALLLMLPGCFLVEISSRAIADDGATIGQTVRGVPVHTAILTRRYGAVVPEEEVAGQELEAGLGATNIFHTVHWRRWNRPVGWGGWGWYGGWGWRGVGGPWYGVGFGPRYYPWGGWGSPVWYGSYWRGPVWGGPVWNAGWSGYPVTTFYAPGPACGGCYGGCCYW